MSVVPVPPKIPGTAVFSAADIQRLKIGDSLVVVGDITCDSLTAVTTITAGTGFTATTGNIVATLGNITATAGSVNSATGGVLGSGASSTTRIGTGANALVGFYSATAVVQPLSAAVTDYASLKVALQSLGLIGA
jgi:hypothetical protein